MGFSIDWVTDAPGKAPAAEVIQMKDCRASPVSMRMAGFGGRLALLMLVMVLVQSIAAPYVSADAAASTAVGEPVSITVLPGSPLYAFKRLWEQVRLAFTWVSAHRAAYLAQLIRLRAAEMVAVSGQGKADLAASLARDQELLVEKAGKALGRLKQTAANLDVVELVEQAISAAMRNLGEATGGLPQSAQNGLDEIGRRLGQGVQRLLGQLETIRSNASSAKGKEQDKQGNQGGGPK
jgi:hypothetical protein